MMRFILDCLRPTRQRAGERDISLEKVTREKEETSNQQNNDIQELQEEVAQEEAGLRKDQEQRHEVQEDLEKLAKQRADLKKQIELIQQQRKEERLLLLSLQEEQEELEQSVQEYEEELSRAQQQLQHLQEDVTRVERKLEGARVRISPLQNSISQSYAEISRAQQRLGELIAELIAVEGPVAMGDGHQQGEEDHPEDCAEEEQEEEQELNEQDLQLHIADDEETCAESTREEEPDRPNPADNMKSSGSSSFTEITLTEVKEEEGSSPRSITPQIDSPDLEEEEEEVSTVQSLMTQTSSHTTIGQFDFYHPDPFTDNDLFRDDLFPKVEVADSTDGFFSDPFRGTDPFASVHLFSQLEEEQYQPTDPLTGVQPEPEPECCVPKCTNNMDDREYSDAGSSYSIGSEHSEDRLHAEDQFDSSATQPKSNGLETRGECDGFEISVPGCSESSHKNNSPSDLADQNSYLTHLESGSSGNPCPLDLRDSNPLGADLSDGKGRELEGFESNHSCPLNVSGDDVGQHALPSPRTSEFDRCDPDGSERSGSPLMDVVKCGLAESKHQVRRHFSCEENMTLCIETPNATPGCPAGNDINRWQFEDSEVCDENHLNMESSQRIRGSFGSPKFSDQELVCRNLNNSRNCDGCVFELCHHYPTDGDRVDTLRANRESSEFKDCVSINSPANKMAECNSGDELVEYDPISPQLSDAKYDTDGTEINRHNHYSSDLTNSGKQEVGEIHYRCPDPFSPEQNETAHFNFSGLEDMEHNILVPVSRNISSCDAGSFELKTDDPFSPVELININANNQQVTHLDPCHLDLNNIFRCDPVGSKDCDFFSADSNDRVSCDSSDCELRDLEAASYQHSGDYPNSAQKNSHIPDFRNVTHCGNFNREYESLVSPSPEPKDKLITLLTPEPAEYKGLQSVSPEPNSESDDFPLSKYDSGCSDTSKTVVCDLRPPELMQFDPFSPEPSDAEMCDVGSESNHCSQSAFAFEMASNRPSPLSSWDLEPSTFPSEGTHSSELTERCEYTPTGTSSDDSVRGHPFDSESSETAGWSLSEFDTSRPTDQNPEETREKMTSCSDSSEQDGCCSELNKVARSSRHSSVPDSIAEMLFGPEPSTARFYPWDIENSNTIVCDNQSPEDSPDTLKCDLVSGYDVNSSVAVHSRASELPNLR